VRSPTTKPKRWLACAAVLLALAGAASSFAADELPSETVAPIESGTPTATPESVLEEHRAQPLSTPVVPVQESERRAFDMHIDWERGLNYTVLQRVRLGTEDVSVLDKDATLTGRIGVNLGVDVAGYLENGSLPELGTRFDVRRILFYTTGEFRFLFPILFKFDLGGVGDSLYFSDFYLWA
jgi:hypothetical protein